MHVRGLECWPGPLCEGIRAERRLGRDVPCYTGRPGGLGAMLARAAERAPDREAVVEGATRLRWRELSRQARRLARGLARLGVGRGDRVATLLPNGVPFCLAVFAAAERGAVLVPLNTKLRRAELGFMLADSGARVLLADPVFYPEVAPLREGLPCEHYVVAADAAPAGTRPLAELLDAPEAPGTPGVEDDPVFVMYTSGTTGRPKGAIGTHANVVHSCLSFQRLYGLRDGERSLVAVPLFHVTGLIAQLLTMTAVAGTCVLMPRFEAAAALRLLAAERITHLVAAPTVYVMLMAQPGYREVRLPDFRVAGYGGAPIASDTVRRLREWLPGARLHNTYGLTETSSPATVLADGDAVDRIATVGRPVPVGECRTVDPGSGCESAADEVGELWVRGPMVVAGYWANPEATAAALVEDGWLRTGDLAAIDRAGYVTIKDRLKDMINRGGEKVYCVEVEEVLCGHPGVLEAAVVGVPDPVYGETVKACVVPRPGGRLDPDDVREWVRARLAKFKAPEQVEVRAALPRNPNGKVVKALLRNPACSSG
ncbi:MAG: acyl--CoA ligase [Candidatus Rokubacteria bacterium]|nr:acyl--CoA ligase [Candidatus Rokubacteria bacterium]